MTDKRRSLFRLFISDTKAVRVVARQGDDAIGTLLDINHKGFRLNTRQKFAPGASLQALIEFTQDSGAPHMIPFKAQCMWADSRESGFAIQEIPMAEESHLDALIEQLASAK